MFRESPHPSPTPTCEIQCKFPHASLPPLCGLASGSLTDNAIFFSFFFFFFWGGGAILSELQSMVADLCHFVLSLRNNDNLRLFAAIDWDIFTSPLKPLNEIPRHLSGSKTSTFSTKFVFFVPIRKIWWPPRPLNRWDIFEFSSETAKWSSTKLDRE